MKQSISIFLTVSILLILMSCRQNKVGNEGSMTGLAFPYQAYLDNMGENEYFPTIGNDGQGFDAISHNIVYPEMPDTLSLSLYADSLLQFYNMILAFKEFARLATTYNIVRNSECMFGNNGNLEDMELFYSVFQSEKSSNSEN